MQKKYYEVLGLLADIAGDYGTNTYSVMNCALGCIPFQNGVNKSEEVGISFIEVANWLLHEAETNFLKAN